MKSDVKIQNPDPGDTAWFKVWYSVATYKLAYWVISLAVCQIPHL